MDSLFSVRDQVVVVSGASRGIGRAIALAFAERGAQVVVTGRQLSTLQKAADEMRDQAVTVQPLVCDVSRPDDIARLVEQSLQQYGRIDTLINVAGVNRRKPALEITEQDYDFVLNTNLKGAFLLSQAVGRHMLARGSGSQINVASLNTDRPLRHVAPYAMSKSALGHMTRARLGVGPGRGAGQRDRAGLYPDRSHAAAVVRRRHAGLEPGQHASAPPGPARGSGGRSHFSCLPSLGLHDGTDPLR